MIKGFLEVRSPSWTVFDPHNLIQFFQLFTHCGGAHYEGLLYYFLHTNLFHIIILYFSYVGTLRPQDPLHRWARGRDLSLGISRLWLVRALSTLIILDLSLE